MLHRFTATTTGIFHNTGDWHNIVSKKLIDGMFYTFRSSLRIMTSLVNAGTKKLESLLTITIQT